MFLQRRRPKLWCVARRPCREFATNSRIFWRKNCAMAAPNARFFRRATRRRLALEPRTSRNFQIGIISEGTAKFGSPRVEMVKNLQQIRASSMQILAKFCACPIAGCARFRHRTRQQLDAEILQHQNVFAATPAEVLVRCASAVQRICNEFAHFLAEKLRSGGAERTVFSARNTAPTCIGATDVLRFSNRNNLTRIGCVSLSTDG